MTKKQIKDWPKKLDAAFKRKFGVKVETSWNIISFGYVTRRADDKPMTKAMRDFISGWMAEKVPA